MTAKQRAAAEQKIRHAMASLVGNPEFKTFMDIIREMREVSIEDACSDRVVSDERASMAAIGEIRVYKSIISVYDESLAQAIDGTDRDESTD